MMKLLTRCVRREDKPIGVSSSRNVARTRVALLGAAMVVSACGHFADPTRAAEPAANKNYMGLGIANAGNNDSPTYADAMKLSRRPGIVNDPLTDTTTDSNGWPTTDTNIYITDGAAIKNYSGTYALRFQGQADISGWSITSVQNKSYNSSTNTTTANLVVTDLKATIALQLRNTRRTGGSALNTGVTNIELMRPVTPGSSTPYAFGTVFTNNIKTIGSKFQLLRFMDFTATNSSGSVTWADRTEPSNATYDGSPPGYGWQGRGAPWEHAVRLSNETNTDMWINIPAKANNDYITKLAQLIRFGSDGNNPYTSTQTSPLYPPLNSNLKVYVEYSNELWNYSGGFRQANDNLDLAIAEVNAGGSPLNYDGSTDQTTWAWRRNAKRLVDISNTFRTVWGDSNMMTRIRPVYEWQYGDGQGTATIGLNFMDNYYNNAAGNYVATPRPVNYYFWGGGAAAYYEPANASSDTLTVDQILSESTVSNRPAQWNDKKVDIGWTAAFGLKRTAYEGGLSLGDDPSHSLAAKKAALADLRLKDVVVSNQNTWSNWGGDILTYFESSSSVGYGHTNEDFSTSMPKLQGIDALNAATKAPLTIGNTAPADIWASNTSNNEGSNTKLDFVRTGSAGNYLLNVPAAGSYTLKISYDSGNPTNRIRVLVNGQVVANQFNLPPAGWGTVQDSAAIPITLNAGKNGVRFVLQTGDISLQKFKITSGATATPTPTPTPGAGMQNASFETPNIGGGAYSYNTANAVWSFAGNSGIQSNGSAWSAANTINGTQTAFLQGQNASNGNISQSWNWNAGTYNVSFQAAQRFHNNALNNQGIQVYFDTTLIGTITPGSSSFAPYTTPNFTATAGNHTLKFQGNSSGGDNTAFIDLVAVNASGGTTTNLSNTGFETPNLGVGNFSYNTTGASWSFAGNCGIQNNSGAWTAVAPPEGSQVAFLQGQNGSNGTISQSFSVASTVNRTVSFRMLQRSGNSQGIRVLLDNTVISTVTPSSSTAYATYTTPSFSVSAGSHTLKFQGTSASGDNTAFIDQVSMN